MFFVLLEQSPGRSMAKKTSFEGLGDELLHLWQRYDAVCQHGQYRQCDDAKPGKVLTINLLEATGV